MSHEHQMNVLEVGQVLADRWVILGRIGQGGMAEIYRARQLNLDRDVAVKVMSQGWIDSFEDDAEGIEAAMQRFRREVQTMAQVQHPHVVQIFDHGQVMVQKDRRQFPYLVMEHIPGGTLRQTMVEGGLYPAEDKARAWVRDYFIPVLHGVKALHALGVVHRDLKPENILMDQNVPKIADFGLARAGRDMSVTDSAEILGSLLYVSPEQFVDLQGADERSDVYALGKILFEAMCGKMTRRVIPMSSVALPPTGQPFFRRLDRVVRHATAEERKDRIASVGALLRPIERLVEDDRRIMPPVSHSWSPKVRRLTFAFLAGAAVVSVVAAAAGFSLGKSPKASGGAPVFDVALPLSPLEDGASLHSGRRMDISMSDGAGSRVLKAQEKPARKDPVSEPADVTPAACLSAPASVGSESMCGAAGDSD